MLLASYKSTRPGLQGIANRIIRWRLRGTYSHSEIVFEPGDVPGHLLPDGTSRPDDAGALWSVSSVAAERLPDWSRRRAGEMGGVRFKRIGFDPMRWDTVRVRDADPMDALVLARRMEGTAYDWHQVAGYASWLIPQDPERVSCAELCAMLLGLIDPWRYDPCLLPARYGLQP